jgi:hypothetical protein
MKQTNQVIEGTHWASYGTQNVIASVLRTEQDPNDAAQTRVYFAVDQRPGEELWCWRGAFESRYVPLPE